MAFVLPILQTIGTAVASAAGVAGPITAGTAGVIGTATVATAAYGGVQLSKGISALKEAGKVQAPSPISTAPTSILGEAATKKEAAFEEMPPVEKIAAAPVLAEEKAAEEKKKMVRRRTKTILTSPQGVLQPASTFQKTLLGG